MLGRQSIIFSSIDNVLYQDNEFSKEALNNLRQLCDKFNAKIVITSSWRENRTLDEIKALFSRYEMADYIFDRTPSYFSMRGKEVELWLRDHASQIKAFLIIDSNKYDFVERFSHRFLHSQSLFMEQSLVSEAEITLSNSFTMIGNRWVNTLFSKYTNANQGFFEIKAVLFGPSTSGKSVLFDYFGGRPYESDKEETIGANCGVRNTCLPLFLNHHHELMFRAVMWDISGAQRYRCLSFAYLRGADIVYLVCDLSKLKDKYYREDIRDCYKTMCDSSMPRHLWLIGNKLDLVMDDETVNKNFYQFAREFNIPEEQTRLVSVKDRLGLDGLLEQSLHPIAAEKESTCKFGKRA